MQKLMLIGAIALSSSAHSIEVSPFIINGSPVVIDNYPSFTSLFYENLVGGYTTSFCGATALNSDYVLTAAHCIVGNSRLEQVTVALQLVNETNYVPGAPLRVSDFFVPATYIESSSRLWPDDIAILKLETSLPTGDHLDKLNFSVFGDLPAADTYVTIGHGLVYNSGTGRYQNDNELLETTLTPLPLSQCKAHFGSNFTDKQICFDGTLPDTELQNSPCDGDSGGPVYRLTGSGYIQVGITSFGLEQCGDPTISTQVTSAFTNVAHYEDWIRNVLDGNVVSTYRVVEQDGERVVIDNSSTASSGANSESGGSSGGSVSVISLLGLLFISYMRQCSRMRISELSNRPRSQN
ncbi:putative serine protease [Vibrio ichthyoenteri ATCC 700023]|uniref:Putative serine protease n=1 Tax=Vibrio ichthyoenteri ATCC 700023 TaxID=870968 RepID=F9S1B1_9VIBR|nr:trypsin-like serine protease [Vibrio ichthyoenteri]EGU41950.1 putative serine protease [Vibrio ichthyoenteri ATCC 700023]